MKICQKHWDQLRKSLNEVGIGHLGAKNPQQVIVATVTDLEGRSQENEFDPLMTCNWMIFGEATKVHGLKILGPKEDGTEYCPICESLAKYEEWWIKGPVNSVLEEARNRKLI